MKTQTVVNLFLLVVLLVISFKETSSIKMKRYCREDCEALCQTRGASGGVCMHTTLGNNAPSNTSSKAYFSAVDAGIINPDKYSFESFLRDEQNVFRDSYREYVSMNETEPINYEEWLVMNNFGILPDTQESLFARKITTRSTADNKSRFVNTVRKGDILITGSGIGLLIGHAAIMITDDWVLEMAGITGWWDDIRDNNRQVRKDRWYDIHASDWTTVYRCPNRGAANAAAVWADHIYYNPTGGAKKLRHIIYMITTNLQSANPSYCSKLVVQAYYYGTGRRAIKNLPGVGLIVPSTIPNYFTSGYKLINKGRY